MKTMNPTGTGPLYGPMKISQCEECKMMLRGEIPRCIHCDEAMVVIAKYFEDRDGNRWEYDDELETFVEWSGYE